MHGEINADKKSTTNIYTFMPIIHHIKSFRPKMKKVNQQGSFYMYLKQSKIDLQSICQYTRK